MLSRRNFLRGALAAVTVAGFDPHSGAGSRLRSSPSAGRRPAAGFPAFDGELLTDEASPHRRRGRLRPPRPSPAQGRAAAGVGAGRRPAPPLHLPPRHPGGRPGPGPQHPRPGAGRGRRGHRHVRPRHHPRDQRGRRPGRRRRALERPAAPDHPAGRGAADPHRLYRPLDRRHSDRRRRGKPGLPRGPAGQQRAGAPGGDRPGPARDLLAAPTAGSSSTPSSPGSGSSASSCGRGCAWCRSRTRPASTRPSTTTSTSSWRTC